MQDQHQYCRDCLSYHGVFRLGDAEWVCRQCDAYVLICGDCASSHTFNGGMVRRYLCPSCVAESSLARYL